MVGHARFSRIGWYVDEKTLLSKWEYLTRSERVREREGDTISHQFQRGMAYWRDDPLENVASCEFNWKWIKILWCKRHKINIIKVNAGECIRKVTWTMDIIHMYVYWNKLEKADVEGFFRPFVAWNYTCLNAQQFSCVALTSNDSYLPKYFNLFAVEHVNGHGHWLHRCQGSFLQTLLHTIAAFSKNTNTNNKNSKKKIKLGDTSHVCCYLHVSISKWIGEYLKGWLLFQYFFLFVHTSSEPFSFFPCVWELLKWFNMATDSI